MKTQNSLHSMIAELLTRDFQILLHDCDDFSLFFRSHPKFSWNLSLHREFCVEFSEPKNESNLDLCLLAPEKNVSEESSIWVKYLNKILLSAFTLASLFSLSSFPFRPFFSTHSLLFHWLARETRKILSYTKFRHRFVSCVAAKEFIHYIQSNDVCLN